MKRGLIAIFMITGCLPEPTFEEAYAAEVDLCAPAAASEYAAAVADCRARFLADGSCAGVLSFRAVLDGVDVISSGDIDDTTIVLSNETFGTAMARLELRGRAPFFRYDVRFDDIGQVADAGDIDRTISLASPAGGVAALDDDNLTFSLRVEDGAASKFREHRTGSVVLSRQWSDEVAGTFTASNQADDSVEGCFHAFATTTVGP